MVSYTQFYYGVYLNKVDTNVTCKLYSLIFSNTHTLSGSWKRPGRFFIVSSFWVFANLETNLVVGNETWKRTGNESWKRDLKCWKRRFAHQRSLANSMVRTRTRIGNILDTYWKCLWGGQEAPSPPAGLAGLCA